MEHGFGWSTLLSAVLAVLITTLFIYFAAKFVLGRSSFLAALGTALIGTFLASIAAGFLVDLMDAPGWAWYVIAVAVWALVAALFFRARWVQGAIIGLVAWVLWALVTWLIGML